MALDRFGKDGFNNFVSAFYLAIALGMVWWSYPMLNMVNLSNAEYALPTVVIFFLSSPNVFSFLNYALNLSVWVVCVK